ncbi:P-loop containing nucleoside triphosphate hydrolase protein [Xylaria intraflava]|nr:P-loop containing nucleoside triphosphate hydrolase protein [Xylaria intraflava]
MAQTQGSFDLNPGNLFDDRQVKLFDSMHRLSGFNVFRDIETPHLVVVGAQSSGKSSVLEALVRFHFPVDNAKPTTRFPIKLVLRRADTDRTQVRIESGSSRSEEQKRDLRRLAEELSHDTFGDIIRKAKVGLEVSRSDNLAEIRGNLPTFCNDILVIERHGPSLPKLSLVDLPGIFNAASSTQTLEDGDMIRNMVSKYISSPSNIILLVISAEVNDYSNVPALELVQRMLEADPTISKRVICVITRPDTAGSLEATLRVLGKESQFSKTFSRPWHVVRNQDQEARRNCRSLNERDQVEEQFFNEGEWATVPSSQKGIAALRETLKSMIQSHTQNQLPHVISKIKERIERAEAQLDSAIRARATPEARRTYLGEVATKFSTLTLEAVKGTYENEGCDKDHETGSVCQDCEGFFPQFGNNDAESQQKRLRANVRALNKAFATAMCQYGKTTEIEIEGATATSHSLDPTTQPRDNREHNFQPYGTADYYVHDKPKPQGRKEFVEWVRMNMDRWKSKGPGGEPSDGAYSGLLAHQAEKWGMIASKHLQAVWQVVGEFIELTLAASCPDNDVLEELRRQLVIPNLRKLQFQADRTLRDLVSCHRQANPGFYDSFVEARKIREYTDTLLQQLDVKIRESSLASILGTAISIFGGDNPFLNNDIVRKTVVPMIAHKFVTFDFDSDSSGNEMENRTESIHRRIRETYLSSFGDIAAARVIEQAEMHYEGIRASFVGYVASLVVERKIMAQLSKKILTMVLIRDQDEQVIEKIAGERPEDAKKRTEIERELKIMREVLQDMEKYRNPTHDTTH